jgi:thiamine-monophosphate kinase
MNTIKLSELGEFGLIERIRRALPVGRGVRLGIGDDAAWLENHSPWSLLTADMLLQDVHFNLEWTSLADLGYKSLAVNISDIAAMGGLPAYATISLGLPRDFRPDQVQEFYRGMNVLARRSGVSIVGGDTSVADALLISVCLLGYAPYRPVSRGGAKPEFDVYVSGTVGDAALGLELLKTNSSAIHRQAGAYAVKRHHRPTPRMELGRLLARRQTARAMIDISDGLLQDLAHVCAASGVGAVVWEEALPRSRSYRALAQNSRLALSGGEDYELLFCAPSAARAEIMRIAKRAGVAITRIGVCVAGSVSIQVVDRNGKELMIGAGGHDHFASNGRRKLVRRIT